MLYISLFITLCEKNIPSHCSSPSYPAGARVDSSNYNPTVSWHVGSQLVALKFQTSDDSPMTINDGRFRENGGCGYVHKPPTVLLPLSDQETSSGCKAMSLRIRVLAGSCLPKPYGESVGEGKEFNPNNCSLMLISMYLTLSSDYLISIRFHLQLLIHI